MPKIDYYLINVRLTSKIEVNFSFFKSKRSKKPLSICQRTIKHLKKCYLK